MLPKLTMLIGLPASGKTDMAEIYSIGNPLMVTISSDEIRKELYGDASVQDNPSKVFEEMRRRTVDALSRGISVIYDATNILRKHRKHLLSTLPKEIKCIKKAVVVWSRYETCVIRDKHRDRVVGEDVIKRMLLQFQTPYYDEGWDEIVFVLNDKPYSEDELDAMMNIPHDNPHHLNTVYEHACKVADEVELYFMKNPASKSYVELLLSAAMRHDVGKGFTKQFKDKKNNSTEIAHYYNHHNVSAWITIGDKEIIEKQDQCKALLYWLINVHMDPFFNTKYYQSLTGGRKRMLDLFHKCDIEGA